MTKYLIGRTISLQLGKWLLNAKVLGQHHKVLPQSIGVCIRGFHLSKTILPPRPILPRMLNELLGISFCAEGSDGGMMPAAANLSGCSGLVNNITGSSGSCMNINASRSPQIIVSFMLYIMDFYANKKETTIKCRKKCIQECELIHIF